MKEEGPPTLSDDAGRRQAAKQPIRLILHREGVVFRRVILCVVNYQLIIDALVVSVRRQPPSENGVTAGRNTIPCTFVARFHLPNPQNGCVKSIEYYQLKAASLAGECLEIFVAAIFTLHAGKTVVQIAAIEIPVNDLLKI